MAVSCTVYMISKNTATLKSWSGVTQLQGHRNWAIK